MKIREIHCKNWILSDHIAGITLYPVIFYNKSHWRYQEQFESLQKHEMIHIGQVEEMGWFKFYSKYITSATFRNEVEHQAYEGQHGH